MGILPHENSSLLQLCRDLAAANFPERFVGAQEDFTVDDDDGGIGFLVADGIRGDLFESWAGFEDDDVAGFVDGVDVVARLREIGPHRRAAAFAFETFLPDGVPGLQVQAVSDAAVVGKIDVPVVNDAGADAALSGDLLPESMRLGDVAIAADFDRDGVAIVSAHSHDDAFAVDGGGVDERIEAWDSEP
jgi:hypothetical protein